MQPLVAPAVWWAKVALSLDGLTAAAVLRLVLAATTAHTDALDVSAVIVVRHMARPVCILNVGVIGMTADAVETWRWCECREEGCQRRERVWWRDGDIRKHVCVQGLGGNCGDKGVQRLGCRWQRWFWWVERRDFV
jgi:hypothetical protein